MSADTVVAIVMAGVALAAAFAFGGTLGDATGRAAACEQLCGEHWAWENRCVCLVEAE